MKISFCIPSLNRPEYLIQTIKSICTDEIFSSQFELIVYNNFSDLSYKKVVDEINSLSNNFNIKYIRGSSRLNIDQSMFEAIKSASGEYLFFIGDDDYLVDDGLQSVINITEDANFDLAIFNAVRINDFDNTRTELIGFSGRKFEQLKKAIPELKKYCTYGNILIKRKYIIEEDFRLLFGTSHAYGCFWIAFFRDYEKDINPTIIVPKQSVVNLRVVNKNYNPNEVAFNHTYLWYEILYKTVGKKAQKLVKKDENQFWRDQSSFLQLLKSRIFYYNLEPITIYGQIFYHKYRYKIFYTNLIVILIMPFKDSIKMIVKKWNDIN
jgi:glycosyltransferase involved in cell wall biosynthesis